jgi:hypothetical protein
MRIIAEIIGEHSGQADPAPLTLATAPNERSSCRPPILLTLC